MKNNVLLTNGQLRKTLAAVRSLGKKGLKVTAAEITKFNPSVFSRYCSRGCVCPEPANRQKYLEWLIPYIKSNPGTVLFTMDDNVMEIAMENRNRLEALSCILPIPPRESYNMACDKEQAVKLALSSGIRCPVTLHPKSPEEVERALEYINLPVVIKPRKSSGSRGIKVITRKKDLLPAYKIIDKKYPAPVIQEYIGNGERFDVCFIYDRKGKLKGSFVQKELRHFPIDMGPSTVQESIECPRLVEMSLAIMEKIDWYGVVELEYMKDADGKYVFMEINPRFWNSLQLSILAGVDFPWMLYQTATGNEIAEIHRYRPGIRCQWKYPGDIMHFIFNRHRFSMNPSFFSGRKNNMYDDMASIDDPLPLIGFILACFRYLADKNMWRFMFKR